MSTVLPARERRISQRAGSAVAVVAPLAVEIWLLVRYAAEDASVPRR